MALDSIDAIKISDAYLAALAAAAHEQGDLREINAELGQAIESKELDESVCLQLQYLRDGLREYMDEVAFVGQTAWQAWLDKEVLH